jgi:hypothetical protein
MERLASDIHAENSLGGYDEEDSHALETDR